MVGVREEFDKVMSSEDNLESRLDWMKIKYHSPSPKYITINLDLQILTTMHLEHISVKDT